MWMRRTFHSESINAWIPRKAVSAILLVFLVIGNNSTQANAPDWNRIIQNRFTAIDDLTDTQITELIPAITIITGYIGETRNVSGDELDKATARFLAEHSAEEVMLMFKLIERYNQNNELIRQLEAQRAFAIYCIELMKNGEPWKKKFLISVETEKDIEEAYKARNTNFAKEVEELIGKLSTDKKTAAN